MNEGQNTQQEAMIGMATFLEEIPPGRKVRVSGVIEITAAMPGLPARITRVFAWPPNISVHCTRCDGPRTFARVVPDTPTAVADQEYHLIHYQCRNCQKMQKVYAIALKPVEGNVADLRKLGEQPPFGPPIPARVLNIAGQTLTCSGRDASPRIRASV